MLSTISSNVHGDVLKLSLISSSSSSPKVLFIIYTHHLQYATASARKNAKYNLHEIQQHITNTMSINSLYNTTECFMEYKTIQSSMFGILNIRNFNISRNRTNIINSIAVK